MLALASTNCLADEAAAAASSAWTATFDHSQTKPRVRYAVGGTTLSASGSEWITLATSQSYVSGVGYAGGGSVGDFKASSTGGGYVAPVRSTLEHGGTSRSPSGRTARTDRPSRSRSRTPPGTRTAPATSPTR